MKQQQQQQQRIDRYFCSLFSFTSSSLRIKVKKEGGFSIKLF